MRITEESVLAVASQWATSHGQDHTMVAITALEAISTLKDSFTGEAYMVELEKLYRQYTKD